VAIQPLQHHGADRIVTRARGIGRRKTRALAVIELIEIGTEAPRGAREPGNLDELGRRHVRLRDRQMGHDRIVGREPRRPFRQWKLESERVIERVAGGHGEPPVPHHVRIERRVGSERRAPLVTRALAVRADDIVVLDADGNRLRVAERATRRMAAAAGIVVVQPTGLVEPEQPAEVRQFRIQRSPERREELRLDRTGEARAAKRCAHFRIEVFLRQSE